ncbi:MAG TPA: NAD(P)-dependent oxidoreductase [Gemmatimonadaceae bacterium]|nr:NAD(P)-dependent oxidoreductase [Gemmatimonadaceae bacterium]
MTQRIQGAHATMSVPRRVFVTGATGVVGRHVVPLLLASGSRVTAVGRTVEARARLESMGATAVPLDLFDGAAARRALEEHDAVINLATHMPASALWMMLPWSWRENDRVRRDASATLVDAALDVGVSRFVQESFAPVYEDGGERSIDETWPQRPTSYNRTVLDAERSAMRFTERGGGAGVVLRFAGFYGPDPFLRDMIGVARRGWSPLPGAPEAYWSSVAHEDAATAAVAALGVSAGAYNVCDDEPLTRRGWLDALAAALGGLPRAPRTMPGWLGKLGGPVVALLARSQRMSNAKLKAATGGGWAPRWPSAREGLCEAVRALEG